MSSISVKQAGHIHVLEFLRRVFAAHSSHLVDSEPAIPLELIADLLPILTSNGLHFSSDTASEIVAFGHTHQGEGILISASHFSSVAAFSASSSTTPPMVTSAWHPSYPGESDDLPIGSNQEHIRGEKEHCIDEYGNLKAELEASKEAIQKLKESEVSHRFDSFHTFANLITIRQTLLIN